MRGSSCSKRTAMLTLCMVLLNLPLVHRSSMSPRFTSTVPTQDQYRPRGSRQLFSGGPGRHQSRVGAVSVSMTVPHLG